MPRAAVLIAGIIACLHAAGPSSGQQASSPPGTFHAGTASILVDLVARDRKTGAPVTDLTSTDVTLLEDGVPQTIDHFAGIRSDSATPPPSIVALAFEPLQLESQALANQGVERYLETLAPADFTGVFRVGDRLETLQTFTADPEAVRRAVQSLGSRTSNGPSGTVMPASTSAPKSFEGTPPMHWKWEEWHYHSLIVDGVWVYRDVLVSHSLWERWYGGDARVSGEDTMMAEMERADARVNQLADAGRFRGLLALVDAMGNIPGRKTIVLFAAGEGAPSQQSRQMRDSIVESANRANVTIYTLDAVGLRIHGAREEMKTQLNEQGQYAAGVLVRDPNRPWTTDMEKNEQTLQEDASTSLKVLAERTGGFAIADTNDFRKGLQAIAADRHAYYLLRYAPKNMDFNGAYRRITLKVPGRNVEVRGRPGYLAVAAAGPGPMLAYEARALAQLSKEPLPADLPVRGTALSTPTRASPHEVSTLISVPGGAFEFEPRGARRTASLVVVGVVRNAAGEVVHKVSQPFNVVADAKADRSQPLQMFRHFELPEGGYSFDYVVYDNLSQKAGGGRSAPFSVGGLEGGLAVGSLAILDRAGEGTGNHDLSNPLLLGGATLAPNLGEPIGSSSATVLSFWLPLVGPVEGVSASLELLKDGHAIGAAPLDVPTADSTGRVTIANRLPLDGMPPGAYALKITVRAGASAVEREASFTLAP